MGLMGPLRPTGRNYYPTTSPPPLLPSQPVRLDLPVERGPLDPQDLGRPALVPVRVAQRLADVSLLHVLQRHWLVQHRVRPGPGLIQRGQPEVACIELRLVVQGDRPLDHVAQLADVPRPRVVL